MAVVRQASALLLAALFMSRGLFAQDSVPPPPAPPAPPEVPGALPPAPADQAHVTLRPIELRYVQQETLLVPQTSAIKGLYVNAWAFGSPKLWHLVRLADETEINAFVVDVKDDTGCLLYPSAVPTAQQIGANACTRAKDAKARLDTLAAHGIYAIARIVGAKDPLLAERKPSWSVKDRTTGGLWRDRIHSAWVDAYNDSVWIYSAQWRRKPCGWGSARCSSITYASPTSRASVWRRRSFRPTMEKRSARRCASTSRCSGTASGRSASRSRSTSSASPPRRRPATSASARCGKISSTSRTWCCRWSIPVTTIAAPSAWRGPTASLIASSDTP